MAAPTLTSTRVLHSAGVYDQLYIGDVAEAGGGSFGWGVTPIAAAARVTFTQTYSTSDATIAALTYVAPSAITAAALTVADGAGTNDGTIGAITDNASTIAAVQELAAQIGKLVTDLTSARTQLVALAADALADKKNMNKIVDALQAIGIVL